MNHNVIDALLPLLISIDSIHLDPANAREGHDVDGIAASLREFGQRTPLIVLDNAGRVLKGNGTLKAAQSLNWTHLAAIRVADDPTTATRYAIADNRLGDKSYFSLERVNKLLESIDEPESVPGVDEGWLEEIRALGSNDIAQDYSDFDQKMEDLDGYQEGDIKITVPVMYREQVIDWLSHGESKTAPGLGKGVMRRCGLL